MALTHVYGERLMFHVPGDNNEILLDETCAPKAGEAKPGNLHRKIISNVINH
jgi:hypothetical protein